MLRSPRARRGRTEKTKVEKYTAMLLPLMEHVHGRTFSPDHQFTRDELLEVNPDNMMRFVKNKVYGSEEANPDTDPIIAYRSNTIKAWKKGWSYFMPNKMTNWDEVTERGNPTRCPQINALIRSMVRAEVARLGMPSHARRSFVAPEFEKIMEHFGRNNDARGAWLAAYFCFQYNMMARVDDTAKFRRPNLQMWHAYPEFGVTAKL